MGLERCAWREGAWPSTAQRRLSLLVPILMSRSLPRGTPERVAGAILSVTEWQEENMLVHYLCLSQQDDIQGSRNTALPSSWPWQMEGTSQEP